MKTKPQKTTLRTVEIIELFEQLFLLVKKGEFPIRNVLHIFPAGSHFGPPPQKHKTNKQTKETLPEKHIIAHCIFMYVVFVCKCTVGLIFKWKSK